MENTFDLARSVGLTQRLVDHLNAGKPDFFGVVRDNGTLCLFTQKILLPIAHLQLDMKAGTHSNHVLSTERDFRGQMLIGWNRNHDNIDIISYADETMDTARFSSDRATLTGSLLVVATDGKAEPQTYTLSVVFSQGNGSMFFGSDGPLARYAHIVSGLLNPPELEVVGEYVGNDG